MRRFLKRGRGWPLSPALSATLQKWVSDRGTSEVALQLGVSSKTILNWIDGEIAQFTTLCRVRDYLTTISRLRASPESELSRRLPPITDSFTQFTDVLEQWICDKERNLAIPNAIAVEQEQPLPNERNLEATPLFNNVNPEITVAHALNLAERGHAVAAFEWLGAQFDLGAKDLNYSIALLPTLIYLGYRYMTPSVFISGLRRNVLPNLQESKPRTRCDPGMKSLCISQIGCALNERGGEEGRAALEYFERADVKEITASEQDYPWPRQQLVRNEAMYWTMHGGNPDYALQLTRKAQQFGNSLNDRRAIATVESAVYFVKNDFVKGWEAMEPIYRELRPRLLAVSNGGNGNIGSLVNVFSGVYLGAYFRSLSGAGYTKNEIAEDSFGMLWCVKKSRNIQLVDPVQTRRQSRLPNEIKEIQTRCTRILYSLDQIDVLKTLKVALDDI